MSYDVTFYILKNKFVPAYCKFFLLTRYSPNGSYEKYQQYENNKLFKKPNVDPSSSSFRIEMNGRNAAPRDVQDKNGINRWLRAMVTL